MSAPLWHRPPKGKKWSVDGATMDRIESEIVAKALEVFGPRIASRAVEEAAPEIVRQTVEAARKQAQREVDAKVPPLVEEARAQARKDALAERKPGTHREFIPERDPKTQQIVKLVETWVPDRLPRAR